MTLPEIAEAMNALFRKYGLDHDVVMTIPTNVLPGGRIQLDPRENEPDPQKWRASARLAGFHPALILIDGGDPERMELLLTTLTYVFDTFFEVHPPTEQLRLF